MRKGEKLYSKIALKFLNREIEYSGLDNHDANVGSELREMTDEEFDEILNGS